MLGGLWNLAAFIIALSILVAIHEFGHFWVARRCGVKVHRFSIGFGKVLYKRIDRFGTEFVIAAIPLGGYVKMLDGRVETVSDDEQQYAFDKKTVWQRIAIVAAGPLANFLLAMIVFSMMYMIGVNSSKPIINNTIVDSPVSIVETVTPFQVIAINGQKINDWEELNLALVAQIGENAFHITVQPIDRDNSLSGSEPSQTFTVSLQNWQFDAKKESIITSLGFIPYYPDIHLEIADIVDGGAAQKAGLQIGDKLRAINGVKLNDWNEFVELIQKNANQTLKVEVERGTMAALINLTPDARQVESGLFQGYIGAAPVIDSFPEAYRVKLQFSPIDAVIKGVEKTAQLTKLTFDTLIKLITGDVSITNLSGPVSIAKGAGMSANYGIEYFLGFLGLISVNLGLMNLIPLPVLDGGHLLYYFVELVTGKTIPEKVQEIGFKVGAAILMMLMTVAILNDFNLL